MLSPTQAALFRMAIAGALAAQAAAAEDVSALLRQQTQSFSDASQHGNAAVLKTLLDDKVVFFNENGEAASKDDLVTGATPAPADVTMAVTDWHCDVHGDVAVASFIDDQTRDLHGQVFHARYRSVETWLKEGATWLMIGSQTMALQTDPPAVTLDGATLDQYAGTYRATADLSATFTHTAAGLTLSANGGASTLQKAELRDVFFTPGMPRVRRIFQRNAQGRITGFVSRREGHDIVFKLA